MRNITFILTILILLTPSIAATDFSAQTQKLTEINKKLESNKNKLAPKKRKKKQTQYKIGKLNRQIRYNELKLNETRKKYKASLKKKSQSHKELASMQQENNKIKKLLQNRITQIHKKTPFSFLELLFSKKSISFDANHVYFFKKIISSDTDLINSLSNKEKKLNQKKASIEKEVKQIKAYKNQIENREKKLISQKKQQSSYLTELDKEIKTILRQNKNLEKLSNEFSELIRKASSQTAFLGTGKFIQPVKGWISSKYGMRMHPIFKRRIKHTGIDIAAPKGRKIVAADSGKVIFAGKKGGYGKSVLIYHGTSPKNGKTISSFYAHQSRILVKKGDIVKKGDEIGWVGSTGYATGPHLHFEMKENGVHVNPLKYIR